jgi:alpha-methylacyl-CoA racemase
MLLADLGADVIRIDRVEGTELGVHRDPALEVTGRGKRSVALDLKQADGRDAAMALISQADVLIEGYRPTVMEGLGLGPSVCLERNPRLIYGRLTGWGQEGPLASAAGHDMNFVALTGALHAIGTMDGPPVPPLNLLGDFAGGSLFLALGIVSALVERQNSGIGQVIDAAIIDGVSALLASVHGQASGGIWHERRGLHTIGGAAPWNTVYEARDGKHITFCGIESRFYNLFLEKLGIELSSLPDRHDRKNWLDLRARFEEIFMSRDAAEWCSLLEGTDCCFAPVLSITEARRHPHVVAREMFCSVEGVEQPRPAPRFSRTSPEISRPPIREPGQHSTEILLEAGLTLEQIESLRTLRN